MSFFLVPDAEQPPGVSAAPESSAADSPSFGSADPVGPLSGSLRLQEKTPAARRRHISPSPQWRDGKARHCVKPETEKEFEGFEFKMQMKTNTTKSTERKVYVSLDYREKTLDIRGVWPAQSRWPWGQN